MSYDPQNPNNDPQNPNYDQQNPGYAQEVPNYNQQNPNYYQQNMYHPQATIADSEAQMLAMLMHLSTFLFTLFGPLIFWLIVKDKHPFLDDQGKESLNFQISIAIYTAIVVIIGLITLGIGFLLLIPLWIFWVIFSIVAAVRSNSGEWYRYPITIRFF